MSNININLLQKAINDKSLSQSKRMDALRNSGSVLYEVIAGSVAYATSTPLSDEDHRGIFCLPMFHYLSINEVVNQISDDSETTEKKKNDDIFFTLKRFFELLQGSNPNVIELLWMPKDCIISSSPEIEKIIANRSLFISRGCLDSHLGYAISQSRRTRGKNKKVNNPCPKETPKKSDFCRIVSCVPGAKLWTHPDVPSSRHPFRPIPLSEMPWVNLADYHVAAVEHTQHQYRMYYYGEDSKGVFRGDDMLVCESIPMDDEFPRFSGILMYDESEYERALKEWKSYHDWKKNRNEARWVDQEKGLLNYDQKNMMHCVRLLLSGLNIIKNGEPIVRFEGDARQHLMDIRNGKFKYEDIMLEVEDRIAEMEEAVKTSSLPNHVDNEAIEDLYQDVSQSAWKRLFGTGICNHE